MKNRILHQVSHGQNMKDRFSQQAKTYRETRPTYPETLFEEVFRDVESYGLAWDAGTGNGQVATRLSRVFREVFASDISEAQLAHAKRIEGITYACRPAEDSGLEAGSVDLVTVAQAIHWFDIDRFLAEVDRVTRHAGVCAVWGYALPETQGRIDKEITWLYRDVLGSYWDPERALVDNHYTSIPPPFGTWKTTDISMHHTWSLDRLQGYFASWSAYRRYLQAGHRDPLPNLMQQIRKHLRGDQQIDLKQRIFLKIAKKPS